MYWFGLLTQKVSDGLERLLLAHDKANFLFRVVSHELRVANASLLPLLLTPSKDLGSDFHQAHQVLFTRGCSYLCQVYLSKTTKVRASPQGMFWNPVIKDVQQRKLQSENARV